MSYVWLIKRPRLVIECFFFLRRRIVDGGFGGDLLESLFII